MADEQLYGAESDTTKAQEIWKHRKAEFPNNKRLKKAANKIVQELDIADVAIEKARKLDKKADEIYDKEKKRKQYEKNFTPRTAIELEVHRQLGQIADMEFKKKHKVSV